jgi:hypothetical protein
VTKNGTFRISPRHGRNLSKRWVDALWWWLALRVRRVRFQLLQFIAIVLHGGGERTKRQGKAIKLCAVNLSQWPHAAPLAVLQTLLIPKPALMCTLSVPTWKISGHREYFIAYWTHTMVHDFLCKYFVLNSMTTK